MVTIKEAKKATDSIVKTLHPFSVVLFGSVARDGMGTDLDLLVVTDDKSGITGDANMLLHKCLKRYYRRFAIDPFIIPLSLLNEYYSKGSPFLQLITKEGRALYMKDAMHEWLKQSEDEVNMAEYLLQGGYFKGACYHAQQSIEKSMKARLFKKGWELEKTHSIERLVAIGRDYRIRFKLSDEEIVFIDNSYRGRYPAEAGLLPLGEPSKADAEKAVHIAGRMCKDVQIALKK
jgi:HEPN domain-containing protein/predicted nucleotidyltransferase